MHHCTHFLNKVVLDCHKINVTANNQYEDLDLKYALLDYFLLFWDEISFTRLHHITFRDKYTIQSLF